MEIVLVRHGKPEPSSTSLITGYQIGDFARRYNALGISKTLPPPAAAFALATTAGCVVSSDLKRSVESAQWLGSTRAIEIDRDLREAGLPESINLRLPLPPGAWVVVARVMWWLNLCRAEESLTRTRARAVRATDRLAALAQRHGVVLVVGHGIFNRFIAADLRRRGWSGPGILPRAYWTTATFTF